MLQESGKSKTDKRNLFNFNDKQKSDAVKQILLIYFLRHQINK